MSTQAKVFITVPKYVAITPVQVAAGSNVTIGSTSLPKIRPAPAQTTVAENDSGTTSLGVDTQAPKGKKRRLDHLTWEEKVQRKKLKNRVAAQTSRDRKKARMEEMEQEIQELSEKTEILANKCDSLQSINDSLLEKNQKLDMEVEQLRQQLQEMQQQRKISTCAGSGLKSKGPTVVTGENFAETEATAEKECNSVVPMACNSSLPALQDMLLPDIKFDEEALDDAEFDAGKLEELAESLLADITAELEASDTASNASDAEIKCRTERLFGSMVGSATESLESSQHKKHCNGSSLDPISIATTPTITSHKSNSIISFMKTSERTLESKYEEELTADLANNAEAQQTLNINTTVSQEILTQDTVYGTYDAKTNSITIVMDDVAIPVSEAVEEIYCEGEPTTKSIDEVLCTTGMTSPSHVYLNVSTYSDDETDLDDVNFNFDSIEKFVYPKRPLVSPLAKSPAFSLNSATSDHGYESIIGSPLPPSYHFEPLNEELTSDDFSIWPSGFNELFPSLL